MNDMVYLLALYTHLGCQQFEELIFVVINSQESLPVRRYSDRQPNLSPLNRSSLLPRHFLQRIIFVDVSYNVKPLDIV